MKLIDNYIQYCGYSCLEKSQLPKKNQFTNVHRIKHAYVMTEKGIITTLSKLKRTIICTSVFGMQYIAQSVWVSKQPENEERKLEPLWSND